jgi:hypothetical protein
MYDDADDALSSHLAYAYAELAVLDGGGVHIPSPLAMRRALGIASDPYVCAGTFTS